MIKVTLTIVLLVILAVASLFFYKAQNSKTGAAPGLESGQLAQCPDSPNCACSEYSEDSSHYAAPINFSGSPAEDSFAAVKTAIESLGGKVVVAESHYLAATFESGFFGFVDDFEARLDEQAQLIHVRSASRVGHSDLGANLKRVNAVKSAL